MGDMADMMIDGTCDQFTGEYIGPATGFPRSARNVKIPFIKDTPAEAKARSIRKELAILIKEKQSLCTTEQEKSQALNEARKEINLKYGKGWRETWKQKL